MTRKSMTISGLFLFICLSVLRIEIEPVQAGVVAGQKDLPKILLLISEKHTGVSEWQYRWGKKKGPVRVLSEAAVAETLLRRGFELVLPYGANGEVTRRILRDSPDIPKAELIRLGKRLKADMVLFGKSTGKIAANKKGETTRTCSGTVTLKAFRVNDGSELARVNETATVSHENATKGREEALTRAGQKAGDIIAADIIRDWSEQSDASSAIAVTVGWSGSRVHFIRFRTALKDVPGVTQVKIREMKPNEATLAVYYNGSADKLAQSVKQLHFDTFGLNVYEVLEKKLNMELIAR